MARLRRERPRAAATSDHMNSRFSGRRLRKKLKCALARVISFQLSVNGLQAELDLVGQALPLAGMAPEEFEEQLDIGGMTSTSSH
jgi:hypothetical protein